MKNDRKLRKAVPAPRRLNDDELSATSGAGTKAPSSTSRPTESVSLNFGKVEFVYSSIDP